MAVLGRSTPLKPILLRGWLDSRVPFSSRTDDFNDGVIDTSLWSNFNATTETGGRGVVTCDTAFNGYRTFELFNIQENSIVVQINPSALGGATVQCVNEFLINTTNTALAPSGTQINFQIDLFAGLLRARLEVGFADAGETTVAYNATTMAWLRIRETAGQIFFDYGPTGAPSSWTNLRTASTPAWVSFATQRASFQAHRNNGSNDTFSIDNYNLGTSDPATPGPVFRPAPWFTYRGKATSLKGFHPGEPTPSPIVVSPLSGRKPFPLPPGATFLRGGDDRPAPTQDVGAAVDGSLPIPISVRLTTDTADILLIDEVRDLTFRSVAPGGFASASVTLARSIALDAPEIALYGRMYIYDTRSGDTLWEGRVEDPGRAAHSDGEQFAITAIGPSGHAKDESFAYLPIDTSVNHFVKFGGSSRNTTVSTGNDASDRDGVEIAFPGGTPAASPQYVSARSLRIYGGGETLGSVRATAASSDTSPSWEERLYVYTGAGSPQLIDSNTISTSDIAYYGEVGSDFTAGANIPHFRFDKLTASSTPTDKVNVFWRDIVIRSVMADEEGNALTDYSATYVTGSQIVQDLVGRFTTQFDGLDAFIETTTTQITQFAYPDGVTVADALNDVIAIEGAFYWAAWETVRRSGLWRFEFRSWPTTVRYEAGIEDGWESPGSATDLYNKVIVSYKDIVGNDQVVYRTSTVDALTAAGLTRTARIELGSENGSLAAAQQAGDNYLAEHNVPSKNGRLTLARQILDYDKGMLVDPWAVRPGGLIRVRGVSPEPNALNPDGRDGVTIFRVVAVTFRASDGTAELELDTDAYSTSQALANLQNRRRRR